MNRRILAIAFALPLALAGCSQSGSDEATTTSETTTSSETTTASSSESTTTEANNEESTTAQAASEGFTPGDPQLLPYDSVGNIGLFLDEAHAMDVDGHYWLCNGGDLTLAQGAPVESGTCEGPMTLAEGQKRNDWSGAMGEIDRRIAENDEEMGASVHEGEMETGDSAPQECTGSAAECGYGYDEQGNANPSSGELQTQYGCEQGYITDPELCAAVGVPL